MNGADTSIMTPLIQYGFGGLCVVLLGILVWLIKALLQILKENNDIIAQNTQAIKIVDEHSRESRDVAIECKNELFKRPCIARFGRIDIKNDFDK